MPKKISSVIYEINVDSPNKMSNYDAGSLVKAVGEDLKAYCGRPVQGFVVASSVADKIMVTARKAHTGGKLKHPIIRAGICGPELIFQVTDKDNAKYEEVGTLHKTYVQLRDKIEQEKPAIANLDPHDNDSTDSANKMGHAMGVNAKHDMDRMPFGKLTGTKSLMLIAHGSVKETDEGDFLYGKNFAGKDPAALVKMLTENPDERKRLSPLYAGTIYLNGCYTATPDKNWRYVEEVYKLLKAKGFTKLQVKGNIGAASVKDDGKMEVNTVEAELEQDRLERAFEQKLGVKMNTFDGLLNQKKNSLKEAQGKLGKLTSARASVWKTTFQATNDKVGFVNAPLVKKIDEEITRTLQPTINRLTTEIADWEKAAIELVDKVKRVPGFKVDDFVGQYGLQVHR